MNREVAFIIALSLLGSINSEDCIVHNDCNECITASSGCFWCSATDYVGQRCLSLGERSTCDRDDMEDPQPEITYTEHKELNNTVLVTPQRIDAILRPGYIENITLEVRSPVDYPLDVYFLMDLSYSTTDDIETMKALANDIADVMSSITMDYRLGFGSFVDKKTLPFVQTDQGWFPWPCCVVQYLYGIAVNCYRVCDSNDLDAPYSFYHHLRLTSDPNQFRATINVQKNSWNHDYPEGGFDAFAQVLACKEEIGWRENAHHIVIYLTDAGFHMGSDGILSGSIHPNNGQCRLNTATIPATYDAYEYFDYPSVSTIYHLLAVNEISTIFACTEDFLPRYETLVQAIPGSVAARLERDSSNLIQLIQDQYNEISQTVSLVIDQIPGLVIKVVDRVCPDGSMPDPENPNTCLGVKIEQIVTYTVSIEITEYTKDVMAANETGITLRIPFFGNIDIYVHTIQECECASTMEFSAVECSGSGNYSCGKCICHDGFGGNDCSCDYSTSLTGDETCLVGDNGLQCSGNGECICGQCQCKTISEEEYYFGQTCECNNFNCPLDSLGRRCSGQGICGCNGTCTCMRSGLSGLPYTGELCDCSPETDSCLSPLDPLQRICVGIGECQCNQCECFDGYIGDFCEICISDEACAGRENCKPIGDNCINCLLIVENNMVALSQSSNCTSCPNVSFITDKAAITDMKTFECEYASDSCSIIIFHVPVEVEHQGNIFVQMEPLNSCPTPMAIEAWTVAVPVLLAVLFIAIAVIVAIKLCLLAWDSYEYRQWKRKVKHEIHATMENPLYEKLHREVINPIFEEPDTIDFFKNPNAFSYAYKEGT